MEKVAPGLFRHVRERALAIVGEQQGRLTILHGTVRFRDILLQMPVDDDHVEIAIVVIVEKSNAPAHVGFVKPASRDDAVTSRNGILPGF